MSLPAFRMDDAVVLITGGGSGIGRATAFALAAQGASIAITELPGRSELAEAVSAEICAAGGDVFVIALDVRATLTIPHVLEQVRLRFGSLDVLVNNAGTQILKPALEIEEEEFDEVIAVNLKGAFMCAQSAAAIMIEQKGGCIINVASQHGVVGNKMRAPYCASKGGLINLTRALAVEWAEYGIRVNSVSPTFVQSEENHSVFDTAELRDEIKRGVPLARAATPAEVAAGICYLASPAAAMVTGHNLLIDGGWTAR